MRSCRFQPKRLLVNKYKQIHVDGRLFSSENIAGSSMSAWQIHSYTSPLKLNKNLPVPKIVKPGDVLVKVKAASINPIDTRMTAGYGDALVSILRQVDKRSPSRIDPFPLTLGRDFSGDVVGVGKEVKATEVGDQVYGSVGVQRQGSHATHVLVDHSSIAQKPVSVSYTDAAAIPYVANTVYAALNKFAFMKPEYVVGQKVLVHAGAGGIGSFAIQLLKCWGASVTATCSSDSMELVKSLGADAVVDRNSAECMTLLTEQGPFDVILDPIASDFTFATVNLLGMWRNCVYVSLVSPLLSNADQYGPLGLPKTVFDIMPMGLKAAQRGAFFTYAYFIPDGNALLKVSRYIDDGKIKPIIEKVVPFEEVDAAYLDVAKIKGRGKTVINVDDNECDEPITA